MNFKKILLTSAFAVSTLGLVACGSESTTVEPPTTPSSASQGEPYVPPEDTEYDIISMVDFDKRISGESVYFTGSFALVLDTNATQNTDDVTFKDMNITVIDPNGNVSAVQAKYTKPQFPTQNPIRINETLAHVDFLDAAFGSVCGNFQVAITATATDGSKDFNKTAKIEFTRPDTYCKAPEVSSSSVQTGVVMVTCDVEVATNGNNALDLGTCTALQSATADIIFTKDGNGDVNASSGNGSMFSPITNGDGGSYDDDWSKGYYPEDHKNGVPTYNTDFQFRSITGTSLTGLFENESNIYVVKTPLYNEATATGFFAFVVLNYEETTNKDFNLTIRVWRAQ